MFSKRLRTHRGRISVSKSKREHYDYRYNVPLCFVCRAIISSEKKERKDERKADVICQEKLKLTQFLGILLNFYFNDFSILRLTDI